jgi:hypothetical protein
VVLFIRWPSSFELSAWRSPHFSFAEPCSVSNSRRRAGGVLAEDAVKIVPQRLNVGAKHFECIAAGAFVE